MIRMDKSFKDIEFIFPKEIDVKSFSKTSSFEPFSDLVVDF